MADNSDIDASASTAAPSPLPKTCGKRSYVLWLTVIIAFMMAFAAVWMSWQTWCLGHRQYALLNSQLKQQQLNTSQLAKDWQTSNQALQKSLADVRQQLKASLNQRRDTTQDWILLKARYYLELAQINAHWSENQATTIALLEQADELLQNTLLPSVLPIRQVIATDISRLKSLPIIDTAGLLSQLDAMQLLIAKLPIKHANPLITHGAARDHNATPSAWRARLRDSMSLLEKLVVITHQEEGLEPILSPMHQNILRESLRLNLQSAEWAVLQHNQAVYQYLLTKAIKDIKRNFDNSTARKAFIEQLQTLQQNNLSAPKPLIPDSLLLLNQLIDNDNTPLSSGSSAKGAL